MLADEKAAILTDDNHNIKVIAGPGSGKTRLIVEKVSQLIDGGIDPKKILVITYTDKAADDLKHKLLGKMNIDEGYVHTFHSFCFRFMRENHKLFHVYKGFRVLDELGQFLFILKHYNEIKSEDVNEKPNKLKNYFGRIKDNFLMRDIDKIDHPIIPCYLHYCEKLKQSKRFDFGDLINCVLEQLDNDESLSKIVKDRFDYIFVDEYQDVNKNQERLLMHFVGEKTRIFVVGDRNQSIYGFRGSDVRVFDNFEKTFENVNTYYLKKNYRSTEKIIAITNRFMDLRGMYQIEGFKEKNDGTEPGSKIRVFEYPDEDHEADGVAKQVKKLKDDGVINNFSDVAILFRSVKGDSKRFIKALKNESIFCKIASDGDLLNLDYIDELIKCLEAISKGQPVSSELLKIDQNHSAFESSINEGPLALFYKVIEYSEFFKDALRDGQDDIALNLGKFTWILQTNSEIFGQSRNSLALERFCSHIRRLNKEFLDTEQIDEVDDNLVSILTLHKAKGLEFPVVIIPGATEENYSVWKDDFIHEMFDFYNASDDMERAFYVGISRAKNLLMLSYFEKPCEYMGRLVRSNDIVEYTKWGNVSLTNYLGATEGSSHIKIEQKAEKRVELTHYKLIEFWKCPFAYKLRFYYNFLIPRAYNLTYGNLVHNLLYHLNIGYKSGEEVNIDELVDERTPSFLSGAKTRLKQQLRVYAANFENELQNIEYPEKPFEITVGGALIRGKIDLLVRSRDDTHTIIEFKSGRDSAQAVDDAIKQITIYAYSQKNLTIPRGVIYFVGSEVRIPVKIDKNQINLDILNTIEEINSKTFSPNTNNCKNCIFSKYRACPYLDAERTPDINEEIEDDVYTDFVSEL